MNPFSPPFPKNKGGEKGFMGDLFFSLVSEVANVVGGPINQAEQ